MKTLAEDKERCDQWLPDSKAQEEMALCGKLLIYSALGCVDCFTYEVTTPKASAFGPSLAA